MRIFRCEKYSDSLGFLSLFEYISGNTANKHTYSSDVGIKSVKCTVHFCMEKKDQIRMQKKSKRKYFGCIRLWPPSFSSDVSSSLFRTHVQWLAACPKLWEWALCCLDRAWHTAPSTVGCVNTVTERWWAQSDCWCHQLCRVNGVSVTYLSNLLSDAVPWSISSS